MKQNYIKPWTEFIQLMDTNVLCLSSGTFRYRTHCTCPISQNAQTSKKAKCHCKGICLEYKNWKQKTRYRKQKTR